MTQITLEHTADATVAAGPKLNIAAAIRPITSAVAAIYQQVPPGSSLNDMAAEIRAEVQGVLNCARQGLQHAKRVGQLLLLANEQVPHGDWTAWIRSNCEFSKRSAEAYMRIAQHWNEIEAKAQSVAELTVNQALGLVKKPKSDPGKKGVTKTTLPLAQPASGAPVITASPPATDATAGAKSASAPVEVSIATGEVAVDADATLLKAVTLRNDEEDSLAQRVVALEESLGQIEATPAICGLWTESSRQALAARLQALKPIIERAVALLRLERAGCEPRMQ